MTYWEAADILEHGSTDYGKILEAGAIALKVIKELNKKLDEAEDAKFRELPKKGPLYGTKSGVLFVDEFCGKYFEESMQKTGSIYSSSAEDTGHHRLYLRLNPKTNENKWDLFTGDICPDCMGYFCVGLVEKGCQSENVKMYAADYIRRCRDEMCTKTLGVPVREEADESGTAE